MTEVVYTREFWNAALALVDAPQKCERCHLFNNQKCRPRITVRVVLTGDGTPLPSNLKLLCESCYPQPRQKQFGRKAILAAIGNLFEHAPEKKERRRARRAHTSVEA